MKCSGPCQQGRLKCPTPMVCEMPEQDKYQERTDMFISGVFFALLLVIVVIAVVSLIEFY